MSQARAMAHCEEERDGGRSQGKGTNDELSEHGRRTVVSDCHRPIPLSGAKDWPSA
jgi:hypothetical protein